MSRCNWLFSSTREALGAGASVLTIVLKPEPLLHQLEHVTALHLRVVFGNGLLQLGEEALAAEATHTRLTMVLAAGSGSADQFLGGDHGSLLSHTPRCFGIASELALARSPVDYPRVAGVEGRCRLIHSSRLRRAEGPTG